ncbi:hypothetical protein BOX15_Mlig010933g1, partial [Macrostomum lignano]
SASAPDEEAGPTSSSMEPTEASEAGISRASSEAISMINADVWASLSPEQQAGVRAAVDHLSGELARERERRRVVCIDSEQQVFDAESRTSGLSARLASLQAEAEAATARAAELQQQLAGAETVRREADEARSACSAAVQRAESLTAELADVQRRLDDAEAAKDAAVGKLEELERERLTLALQLDEKSSLADCQTGQIERLETERQHLEERVHLLESQLAEQEQQNQQQPGVAASSTAAGPAESAAATAANEELLASLRAKLDNAESRAADLQARLDAAASRSESDREERQQLEESYQRQLLAERAAAELCKTSAEEQSARCAELSSAAEGMRARLSEFGRERESIERRFSAQLSEAASRQSELEATVNQLRAQLDEARSEVDRLRAGIGALSEAEIERLAPAAAATSRMLKRGKTLTQIYAEHVEVQGQLSAARLEADKANLAVAHILEEVQAKVPVIRRRQEECRRVRLSAVQLAKRLDESVAQMCDLKRTNEELERKAAFFERENARLKARAGDLGEQVASLLAKIESSGGRPLAESGSSEAEAAQPEAGKKPADSQQQAALDLSALSEQPQSTQEVITSSLLTFADIRQLQQRNISLVEASRELAARLEVLERERSDASELRVKLESATSELQLARSAEKQHRDLLKVASQQRDMYKLLLESARNSSADPAAAAASVPMETDQQQQQQQPQTTAASTTLATSGVASDALSSAHAELSKLRTELSSRDRQRATELNSARAQLLEAQRASARLSSKLETAQRRAELGEAGCARYRREIDILREMNEKYTGMLAKHEQEASHIRRCDLAAHRAACRERQVACVFCSASVPYRQLNFHYLFGCSNFPMPCPHRCGRVLAGHQRLHEHVDRACPLTLVLCPFASFGCPAANRHRRDLGRHVAEAHSYHLQLLWQQQQHPHQQQQQQQQQRATTADLNCMLDKLVVNLQQPMQSQQQQMYAAQQQQQQAAALRNLLHQQQQQQQQQQQYQQYQPAWR